MSLTEEFIKKFVGNRPGPLSQTGGLENFARDLQVQLAEVKYKNRLKQVTDLLILFESLASWTPDSKSLARGAPISAVVLLAFLLEACNVVPEAMANTGSASVANTNNSTQVVGNEQDPSASQVVIEPGDGAMPLEIATTVAIISNDPNSPLLDVNTNLAAIAPPAAPSPIPTSQEETEVVAVPEIVFKTVVNKRPGPGTVFTAFGDPFKNGSSLEISKIKGKVDYTGDGRTWLFVIEENGKEYYFAYLPGSFKGDLDLSKIPIKNDIPTPPPTPTRKAPEKPPVVETTNIKYVTVPPGTFLFSSIGSGKVGETAGGPAEYKVIKESRGWFQIECPVDGKQTLLWILSTGMSVRNQAGTTNIIQPTNPGVGQNPNPETAPTTTGTRFGGFYVGQVEYVKPIELDLKKNPNSRFVWNHPTATITPITKADNSGAYHGEEMIFNVGKVEQNADGTFSVLGAVLKNSDRVYVLTFDTNNGSYAFADTGLNFNPDMVFKDQTVGVRNGQVLLFVP